VVHTGPKSQLGGLKKGLFNEAYQVGIAGVVKIEPIIPAEKQRPMASKNGITFILGIIL
jgi:hypothetical protein